MDNEDDNVMTDLLASSIEGNALAVQDAVNSILSAKALEALASMKVDVAQSIYGNYGSEQQDAEIEASDDLGPEDPEDETDDWEIPEDDVDLDDQDIEDLFAELEDLTDQQETEEDDSDE